MHTCAEWKSILMHQLCVFVSVCAFGMKPFPGPSGSASHGVAVKVPGRGLSGVSATWAVCLIVGNACVI